MVNRIQLCSRSGDFFSEKTEQLGSSYEPLEILKEHICYVCSDASLGIVLNNQCYTVVVLLPLSCVLTLTFYIEHH